MNATEPTNPLFKPQREKAGATTLAKYAYQYHWALYRVLKEHAIGSEYAVFVEMHEDVVLSSSLDESSALFEFNQVKTNKGKFTAKALVKLKNGSSVLGKLVSSSEGKAFSDNLSSLNLVAVNGFSLPFKKEGLELHKITTDDIHDDTLKVLSNAIKKELAIDELPSNLHFLIPDLPDEKFQDMIIAEISKLISALFSNPYYDSVEIYRVLYDDISRKGMITYDIKMWNDFLSSKALTSNTVTQVINQFTQAKDEASIQAKFSTIAAELGLNSIRSKNLERAFNRYRQNRVGNRSVLQVDTIKELDALIKEAESNEIVDWNPMFDFIGQKMSAKNKVQFSNENDLKAAIIYEFIIQQ